MPLEDVFGFFILILTLWIFVWATIASIRFIHINVYMITSDFELDKKVKFKNLLFAQLYDNLLELKVWNPAERIKATNKRARDYESS